MDDNSIMTQKEWCIWRDSQLKDSRWKVFRNRILRRDRYSCRVCGKKAKEVGVLHVHHLYYICDDGEPRAYWCYPDNAVVTLCPECHTKEHDINSSGLYDEIQNLKRCGITFSEIIKVLSDYKETVIKANEEASGHELHLEICKVAWKARLSKRAVNILSKNGINTLFDLNKYKDNGYLIKEMIGPKAYNSACKLMNEYGLYIKFGI